MGYDSAIKKNETVPFAATWMEPETLILSEISQKEKDKYHMVSLISDILYTAQMNVSKEKKIMDLENRLVVAQGEREGVGGIGSLGLMDANYCSWNGFTMRSCCVALRTMSRYLQCSTTMGEKIMYTCMCNWVPMLYSGKKSVLGEIPMKNK